MDPQIATLNERIKEESAFVDELQHEIGKVIVGQRYMVERLIVGLLANGHILLEGVPGLAKTTTVKVLAQAIRGKFQRLQFTPDLLPADLLGTMIYNQNPQHRLVAFILIYRVLSNPAASPCSFTDSSSIKAEGGTS